jgi:hypothetical protein
MSFLDKFKDKADGLVQAAKDKVTDVTGVDTDKLIDAAGSIKDAGGNLSDAADSLREGTSWPDHVDYVSPGTASTTAAGAVAPAPWTVAAGLRSFSMRRAAHDSRGRRGVGHQACAVQGDWPVPGFPVAVLRRPATGKPLTIHCGHAWKCHQLPRLSSTAIDMLVPLPDGHDVDGFDRALAHLLM